LDLRNDGIADYIITNNYTSLKLSCLGHNAGLIDNINYPPRAALLPHI